jgi:hypothetical protein
MIEEAQAKLGAQRNLKIQKVLDIMMMLKTK